MKELSNVDLFRYSTMRLHSIADEMYFPENVEELKSLIQALNSQSRKFYIVSAGSNIVFKERVNTPLICLMGMEHFIEYNSDGSVDVSGSVRIQQLLSSLKKNDMGGIEYLASVPTSVGGAVYMNAGRGRKYNKSISDYIESVTYLDVESGQERVWNTSDGFSYRHSPFQDNHGIIISARFKFKRQDGAETARLIKERLQHSNKYLSPDKPSCGSVFCKANPIIMRLLRGLKRGGAKYSSKTPNWISNVNNATASDIIWLVNVAVKLHKLFCCKIKREIRIIE